MTEKKGNMYPDMVPHNTCKGCLWNCNYCEVSFKAQAKRQKPKFDENGVQYRGCQDCYDYIPHHHLERLNKLPSIRVDQWIWEISSGDICFMKEEWVNQIIEMIKKHPLKTFFFQTKSPECFKKYEFPENVVLGITLETDKYLENVTNAPDPWTRKVIFEKLKCPRKVVTIEPIMKFTLKIMVKWIKEIGPERVYLGFNSKPKRIQLIEPTVEEAYELAEDLLEFTDVRLKYMKEDQNQTTHRRSKTLIPSNRKAHRSLGEGGTTSPIDRYLKKNGGELS